MIRKLLLTSAWLCTMASAPALAQAVTTIEAAPLQEVGPWGAAALPQGLERLDSDLWQGADTSVLALAFDRISADLRFPSLQRLVRQAVFSGGTAPADHVDLARARFQAANRLGPSEAAKRLFETVPRLSADPALVNLAIDAALRAGQIDAACQWVATPGLDEANRTSTSPVWLETRATCYALNGEAAAANLSVDLARGKGQTDTWLGRAVAAVSGPVSNPPPFRADSGRALALSMKAQLKLPKALGSSGDPAALSALLTWPEFQDRVAPEDAIAFARRAAQTGVASPAQEALLRQPPPSPLSPPPPAADTPTGPLADGLAAPIPAAPAPPPLAEIWAKSLSQATSAQSRALEARLIKQDLKSLVETTPDQIPTQTMPLLIEAALWAGDGRLANAIERRSPTPMSARQRLVVAMLDPIVGDRDVQRHIETAATATGQRQAMRDALIAWSAGMPTQGGLAGLILPGLPDVKSSQAGVRTAISLAAERGSKGEVALLVGLALQGQEPASADAETVAVAVRALRRVNLSGQALDLARDYLLALEIVVPSRANSSPPPPSPTANPKAASPAPSPRAPSSTAPAPAPKPATPAPAASGPKAKPAPAQPKAKASPKPTWIPPK